MLILSWQVVQLRWSSALTATTTPISTLAHGSTAPTPIWGRTTLWIRLFQAWRRASVSMPNKRTQHWKASLATRTPLSFSPHMTKGWAAALTRSTTLMVRLGNRNSNFTFLEQDGETILGLSANYHVLPTGVFWGVTGWIFTILQLLKEKKKENPVGFCKHFPLLLYLL